jgi:hypothetical protein
MAKNLTFSVLFLSSSYIKENVKKGKPPLYKKAFGFCDSKAKYEKKGGTKKTVQDFNFSTFFFFFLSNKNK